ncbi:DUF2063 domain-containing protein [Chitinophaga sp. sic0106]|uniref:HvfC/BufC N-terminal domain-containing protein n=1 Tax=Chitinophaga sp. sic0106 TaxID=2854785 RepID=UPI001C437BBD|nr:putative DNA-binding domain-containing protein [Chitinophaga sp. sic0106]MBV7532199.1 DNA-binding domain-containing protein [Chitinophaga sp. sic0106]
MKLSADTYKIQQDFSHFIRTGKAVRIPGVNPAAMAHYRRLVYNVVKDALETGYPIAFANLPRRKWDSMVYNFFSTHACTAYQVWKLPLDFYTCAVENSWEERYDIPYLPDLLSFEWAEMELYNMEDVAPPAYLPEGDWLLDTIVFNPEQRLLHLKYPVHQETCRRKLLQQAGAYFVLVYRMPDTGDIHFTGLSPWLAFVVEQLLAGITLTDILEYAPQLNIVVNNNLQGDTIAFLQHLQEKQVVLGFIKH